MEKSSFRKFRAEKYLYIFDFLSFFTSRKSGLTFQNNTKDYDHGISIRTEGSLCVYPALMVFMWSKLLVELYRNVHPSLNFLPQILLSKNEVKILALLN